MPKYYPVTMHRKAEKLEHLMLGLEEGACPEQLCAELGLQITPERAEKLKAKYEAGGCRRKALLDGQYSHQQKVNSAVRVYLHEREGANSGDSH